MKQQVMEGKTMKARISLALGIWMLFFLGLPASLAEETPKIESPKVVAVLHYADWCASCKVLKPKLNRVKRDFQGKSILFTRFDLTDDFTKEQSARYAALVGLESLYRENAGKTGYLSLVDGQSKKLLGKVTKDKNPDEIKSLLTKALAGDPLGK